MAEPDLIDRYLTELHRSLGWRRDVVDLLAEVEDHLREAVERLEHEGTEAHHAQRATLDRFGDSVVVARAFAITSSGGIAMPTTFTRAAGAIAGVAAVAWLVSVLAGLWQNDFFVSPWSQDRYTVWTVTAVLAAIASGLTLAGLLARTGSRGFSAVIAFALLGLGVVAAGVATWGFVGWGVMLSLAFLPAVLRVRAVAGRSARSDWLLVLSWPVGSVLVVVLEALRVGPVDGYGDYQLAFAIGYVVAALSMASGLVGVGRWLRSEEAVDVPEAATPA